MLRVIILGLVCFVPSLGAPAVSTEKAQAYLAQFGYIEPTSDDAVGTRIQSILPGESMRIAIAAFQEFAGIKATGEIDSETAELMVTPRCGVKDKLKVNTLSAMKRLKRYATQGSRWSQKDLTYRILKYPKGLKKADVDEIMERAFNVWSQHADITFKQIEYDHSNIEISFEIGEHGDGDPFDGPGGTLAHAYFPTFGGNAHFDDAETWTKASSRGTNLFQVAAHEFGHSLGLLHSDVRTALMAPFYRGYDPNFFLGDDDIKAIQELYGPPPKPTEDSLSATNPRTLQNSELCLDPVFDTIFTNMRGDIYVFKRENFYLLRNEEVVESGVISQTWPGLPGNIDAAFMHSNGKTYFFKGSQFWKYSGLKMNGSYPKDITQGFPGIPSNIDAVFEWPGNNNIYFFQGSYYWRFNPSTRPSVPTSFPKHMSVWQGLPHPLDGGLSLNGVTYFFKNAEYYRFDDKTFAVAEQSPAYPRLTSTWWFGCDTTDTPFDNPGDGSSGRGLHKNSSLLLSTLLVLLTLNHLLTRTYY